MLLISIFLRFLGGVKIDTVVFAGKLGAVCAVDDHGIAVANERRVLSGRGLTAGGICRNGQFRTVGDDDNLALCIGAVNRRVQRLQPRQHVRAGVSIVVVRSDADDRYGGLHSGQKASDELVGLPWCPAFKTSARTSAPDSSRSPSAFCSMSPVNRKLVPP